MIYPHQQKAINYITEKFKNDPNVLALFISGSIAHGFNDEYSDVDIIIIANDEYYQECKKNNNTMYYESATQFYEGGYFDGHIFNMGYLAKVAERGNEPTRYYFHDVIIALDKTKCAKDYIDKVANYNTSDIQDKIMRLLAQLEGWKWFCYEGFRKGNKYLVDTAVSKIILFSARLILIENRIFFPYHKWVMHLLETAPKKPIGLIASIDALLDNKTKENVEVLYNLVKDFKEWTTEKFNWCEYWVHDIETVWQRQEDFVENI